MTASTIFLLLLVLACPLMMIWMMRGGHGHGDHGHSEGDRHDHSDGPAERKSAAELRRQRDELERLIEWRQAEEQEPTPLATGRR